ncbi:MAG: hypothetical protein M3N68_12635 [Actinomycetota bacterium]|nr:hypothetical protein [Actinomycetota bacterium]
MAVICLAVPIAGATGVAPVAASIPVTVVSILNSLPSGVILGGLPGRGVELGERETAQRLQTVGRHPGGCGIDNHDAGLEQRAVSSRLTRGVGARII